MIVGACGAMFTNSCDRNDIIDCLHVTCISLKLKTCKVSQQQQQQHIKITDKT